MAGQLEKESIIQRTAVFPASVRLAKFLWFMCIIERGDFKGYRGTVLAEKLDFALRHKSQVLV